MTAPTLFDAPAGETPRKSGPRVTPTAYLVLPATAPRDEWLAARREGIGASDVGAILGIDDFGTPRKVYYDKLGQLDDDQTEAAYWGSVFEEPIARDWARRNRSVVARVGIVARRDDPVMRCTLDRRIIECPLPDTRREKCALEVKCRSAFKANRWHAGAPDDVLAQCLWQLAVTGYDHVHYAVLIGGNEYRQGVIRRADHEETLADIVTACRRWWDAYVVARVVPPQSENPDREVQMYRHMHKSRDGVVHLDYDPHRALESLAALEEYEDHRLAAKREEGQQKAAQAEMLRFLGDAQTAVFGQDLAYSMEVSNRTVVNLDRLAERWPEAYADCVRTKQQERLVIGAKYRKKGEQE